MPEEIFDVVDAEDRVIGQAPRSEVHAHGLTHRAVHVFVFDGAGRLLLQKRSATKDEFPLCYTSSASGHLSAGESYESAAVRELAEELGLHSSLEFLQKFSASANTANEHTALYRTTNAATPTPDPEEIACCTYHDLDDVTRMIERNPAEFSPPFRILFEWYLAHHNPP